MAPHDVVDTFKKTESSFFYGYVITALSCIIAMVNAGANYTFGIFFKPLLEEFGWTKAATSGAFSLYILVAGVSGILAGKLTDRFGPRIVLTLCGILLGSGYYLMSQVSVLWQVYVIYGIVLGIGGGFATIPLLSTLARWFVKKRGFMTGIFLAGASVGIMVIPPAATELISSYGWRSSYVALGLCLFITIIMTAQFLRYDPSVVGLYPDGSRKEISQAPPDRVAESVTIRKALLTQSFWLLSLAYLCFGIVLFSIMVHLVPHTVELGVPMEVAARVFIVIGGFGIVGRISMGFIADKLGMKQASIAGFILMTITLAWLLISKGMWMIYMFSGAFGFAYGAIYTVQSPLVAERFGLSSHGAVLGLISFLLTIGTAIGPVMTGHLFDMTNSYQAPFTLCVICSALGVVGMAFLTPSRKR